VRIYATERNVKKLMHVLLVDKVSDQVGRASQRLPILVPGSTMTGCGTSVSIHSQLPLGASAPRIAMAIYLGPSRVFGRVHGL